MGTLQEQNFEDLTTCGEQQVFLEECQECDDCVSRGLDNVVDAIGGVKGAIEENQALEERMDSIESSYNGFNQQIEDIWAYIIKWRRKTFDYIYPVGSIYISTDPTDPAYFYEGVWERFGKGKTLVGVNEEDTRINFDTVEKIGGSEDAVVVSHYHYGPEHSHNMEHTHTHKWRSTTLIFHESGDMLEHSVADDPIGTGTTSGPSSQYTGLSGTEQTSVSGVDGTNKNLQPYITVYMWKRIG